MTAKDAQTRRQDVLVRAALALASELSLPAVLQKIADLAAEVADATYAALGVLAPDGKMIQEFVTYGVTDEQRRAIGHLPEGHGILGVLITEHRPLRLPRLQDHPLSIGFPPNHPPMTTFLGVPVAIRGRVFGNLYLTEKRDGLLFTQEDEDAVVQLAAHAAVAVENARLYREAEMGQQLLTAVNQVANAILEGRDIDEVLQLIARGARELAAARIATISTPHDAKDLLVRVADGEGAEAIAGMEFASEGSVSDQVMKSGEPLILDDASVDEGAHQPLVSAGRIGPALFVPLAVRNRTFGTLAVGNHAEDPGFTSEQLDVVRTFASQAAVALEHARITDELQRLALVEDRERIAKELHDDIIQSLFAEGMALQASLSVLHDPGEMEIRITQAVDHIDRVIRDLRNYIFELRPGASADRQLDRAIRDLASGFAHGEATIDVATDKDAVSRLAVRSVDVLSAAREAISNAVRHSGAGHVQVRLVVVDGAAVLEVEDDGSGFDPNDAAGRGHGLGNLRARAESMGGDLSIDSEPKRGTVVRIKIPL